VINLHAVTKKGAVPSAGPIRSEGLAYYDGEE